MAIIFSLAIEAVYAQVRELEAQVDSDSQRTVEAEAMARSSEDQLNDLRSEIAQLQVNCTATSLNMQLLCQWFRV